MARPAGPEIPPWLQVCTRFRAYLVERAGINPDGFKFSNVGTIMSTTTQLYTIATRIFGIMVSVKPHLRSGPGLLPLEVSRLWLTTGLNCIYQFLTVL